MSFNPEKYPIISYCVFVIVIFILYTAFPAMPEWVGVYLLAIFIGWIWYKNFPKSTTWVMRAIPALIAFALVVWGMTKFLSPLSLDIVIGILVAVFISNLFNKN